MILGGGGGGAPVGRARSNNGSPAASPQTRSHDPLLPLTRTAGGESGESRAETAETGDGGGCRRWREVEVVKEKKRKKERGKTPVQTRRGHATSIESSTATQHTVNN